MRISLAVYLPGATGEREHVSCQKAYRIAHLFQIQAGRFSVVDVVIVC